MTGLDDSTLRRHIAAAVEAAHPVTAARAALLAAFVRAEGDCALHALDMDSLALMEFCIALELSIGVALTPEDVQDAQSLGGVVATVLARS